MPIQRSHSGTAAPTTLTGAINASDLSIPITDGTGWPTGPDPFVVTLDRGTASEEKVLVEARVANTLTVQTRGYDGTTATSHDVGAAAEHTISAVEMTEANAAAIAVGALQTQVEGAWADWTPVWTGISIGNGTVIARWKQIGDSVFISLQLLCGTTTDVTGSEVKFSLPVDANISTVDQRVGLPGVGNAGSFAFLQSLAIMRGDEPDQATLLRANATGAYVHLDDAYTDDGFNYYINGVYEAA